MSAFSYPGRVASQYAWTEFVYATNRHPVGRDVGAGPHSAKVSSAGNGHLPRHVPEQCGRIEPEEQPQ